MNILVWTIFGALAGWIASIIMHTNGTQGWLANIVIGIAGALIGGFVVGLFGADSVTGFNLYSLLVAVLGSVLLLYIINAIK